MAKKFKFRKMYFHCKDGKVIEDNVQMTNAYRERKIAEETIKHKKSYQEWDDKTIPLPKMTVEGFYLVHESLFEE